MGLARNAHVKIDFDSPADAKAVEDLGIDLADTFVFAFADWDEESGCNQIKTAVLTKDENEFDRLLPVAHAAGFQIPDPIVRHVQNPAAVYLEDCCQFNRNVQVIALSGPEQTAPETLQSVERLLQSVVIRETDLNPTRAQRGMVRTWIASTPIVRDCREL